MKIGVVCFSNSNYGNNLTNFALYRFLCKNYPNDTVSIINCPREYYSDYHGCEQFAMFKNNKYDNVINPEKYENLEELGTKFDLYISGSDQGWRLSTLYLTNMFTSLDWVDANKPKISYASSFGTSVFEGDNEYVKLLSNLIGRYSFVSVREFSGKTIINEQLGVKMDVEYVLDPVLLSDKEMFDDIIKSSSLNLKSDYISAYVWDRYGEDEILATCIKEKYSADSIKWMRVIEKDSITYEDAKNHLSVEDWIKCIGGSKCLITDSYHGICVALSLNKEFFFLRRCNNRGDDRILSLLNLVHLENRIIDKMSGCAEGKIDYEKVNHILQKCRIRNHEWFKRAIDNKLSQMNISDDIFEAELKERREKEIINQHRFNGLKSILTSKYATKGKKLEIIVWGTGNVMHRNWRWIKHQLGVKLLFDSDKEKWGQDIYGMTCVKPMYVNNSVVLIFVESDAANKTISRELLAIKNEKIVDYSQICECIGYI